MTLRSHFLAVLCLFWGFAPAGAQDGQKQAFSALLEQVKKADPAADFLKLRMSFTETAGYKPYDPGRDTHREMLRASQREEHEKAVELAEKVLASCFVDAHAHSVAYRAYTALDQPDKAKFHRYVHDGLVQSILKSGDGKKPATAYVVISTNEQYAVLNALGIRTTQQALVSENGQKFDRIDGVDVNSNGRVTLYFNISRQFAWLEEQFKKGK